MDWSIPPIRDVRLDPELATIAVLDAALQACRASLIAEHPDASSLSTTEARPLVVVMAALVVARTTELRLLLDHYQLACEEFRQRHCPRDPDPCF